MTSRIWARKAATALMWSLALLIAVGAARYFLVPPPLLRPKLPPDLVAREPIVQALSGIAEYLYVHHRALMLTHIGCGIVALAGGLVQFLGSVRASRPKLHRAMGLAYLAAVLVGGATGMPLGVLFLDAFPEEMRPVFHPSMAAFLALSLAWVAVSAMAFRSARRRRFGDHRAWMIRSYSLTFAAVTARAWAPLFLLLSAEPVLLANGGILLWPLNLIVAEWLVRRTAAASPGPALSLELRAG